MVDDLPKPLTELEHARMSAGWKCVFPTEPGSYWFYGFLNGDDVDLMHFAEVFRHAGDMHIKAGSLVGFVAHIPIDKSITWGHWMPADVPCRPKGF